MSVPEHRHSTHLHGCFLKWDGHNGEVIAQSPDGVTRIWPEESNKNGKALVKAIAWCKAGCPTDKPETPEEGE